MRTPETASSAPNVEDLTLDKDTRLDSILGWLLVAVAFALPFYIAVEQNLFALATLVWLVGLVRRRGFRRVATPLDLGFALYLAAELISLPFSTNLPQSVVYLKRFLLIVMVYLVGSGIRDERWLRRVLWGFLAGMSLYSVWGLVWFVQHPDVRLRHIQNSMTTGGLTMIGVTLALAVALKTRERGLRWGAAIATFLTGLALFLTNTRGSWLGFFFALLLILWYTRRRWLWAVPVVLVLGYLLVPPAQKARVRGFFSPKWESNANRLMWWRTGVEIFKHYPIVGIGDVGTEKMYRRYQRSPDEQPVGHMHNIFLHIAVTLGVVGLSAFVAMLVIMGRFLWRTFKRLREDDLSSGVALGAFAVFVAFLVNGLFEWNFGDAEVVTAFWFVVGLAVAVWRLGARADGEELAAA